MECRKYEVMKEIQKALDRLAAYERTGLSPEQLKEIEGLYLDKCREMAYYKNLCSDMSKNDWITVEKKLPEPNVDVLVSIQSVCRGGGAFLEVDCIMDGDVGPVWRTHHTAAERVLAWRPLPEPYRPGDGEVPDKKRKGMDND